jgi:hypothetical protein
LQETHSLVQQELSAIQKSAVAKTFTHIEKEEENLREERDAALEQVRILTEKLRHKERAEDELKETFSQRIRDREKQVHEDYSENAKNEAWKLKTGWEDWCRSKRLFLDKNHKLVQGEVNFTEAQMKHTTEIIRRRDPDNETLFQSYIWIAFPDLESEE